MRKLAIGFGILVCAGLAMAQGDSAKPTIEYELEFQPGRPGWPLNSRPTWLLTVRGSGLDPEQGAANLVFHSWGGWMEIDSLYLDIRKINPPLEVPAFPGNSLLMELPNNWNGSFEAQIAIHPLRQHSAAQSRWGMLPAWSPSYSFGQTRNVFPTLYQDHGPVDASHRVKLLAPKNCPVASGWAGISKSPQTIDVNPNDGNGFIAFGKPLDQQDRMVSDRRLQVLQYGEAFKAAPAVAELVAALDAHITTTLNVPPPDPSLVFITDIGGGGMGAEYGLVLGFMGDTPDWQATSPYYFHFVAHEFFHTWLGNNIDGNESIVWFHEGFTDYLSLWHLAAAGLISQDWFAERITELGDEAREKSAWGKIAFAQTEQSWRDGDGPIETMAYKGGLMLAFALDVELRNAGKPGLPQLMRDLLAHPELEVNLATLRQWCADQGLENFWQQYVVRKTTFDPREKLAEVGFNLKRQRQGEGKGEGQGEGEGEIESADDLSGKETRSQFFHFVPQS